MKNIANSSKTNTIKEDAGVIATYWDEYYELMPRHNLEKIQLNRLKKVLIRAYHNLPYYRQKICLLYTSPSPRDRTRSRMPSSA